MDAFPLNSEWFLAHVVSSPASHLTSSHACGHFDLFQMQLSCCPHYASRPSATPALQHCQPEEAACHLFPGLANRPAVLLPLPPFLQEDFSRLCMPRGDQAQAGSTSALALQLAHPLMGAPQDLQQCTPLSIIASSLELISLSSVFKCVLMANLHDQAAQRPPRLPLLSLLSLLLKKPARQSPGVCHMGPFLCPPFILAFPFYPRRGMKQCWLI